MSGQESERTTYDLLENWRNQLQLSYVRLATKIARYERDHMLASDHELYVQLDRVERDIARAEYALKLFRIQHMHIMIPIAAGQAEEAA